MSSFLVVLTQFFQQSKLPCAGPGVESPRGNSNTFCKRRVNIVLFKETGKARKTPNVHGEGGFQERNIT